MNNVLEKIVAYKREEIAYRKTINPVQNLEKGTLFGLARYSMKKFLANPEKTGIIAEFKRKSPSKGIINDQVAVEFVTAKYAELGASAISVLTDGPSFGGSADDLIRARMNQVPLLRKDFILDEYQLVESRSMGADVILLIAACLAATEVKILASTARNLGLEVLLEIHAENELDHICDEIDFIGINNRDLKTFTVDVDRSIRLAEKLPSEKMKIAESGIRDVDTLLHMQASGFNGFLIGEQFMRFPDPTIAFASFVDQLKTKIHEGKSLRNDTV